MPKRSPCTSNEELQNRYPFLKIECRPVSCVKYSTCGSEFPVAHGGRADIKARLKSSRHENSLLASAGSSKLIFTFQKFWTA